MKENGRVKNSVGVRRVRVNNGEEDGGTGVVVGGASVELKVLRVILKV